MDKLHKEHEFVQKMWKYMKACEERKPKEKEEQFWMLTVSEGEALAHQYSNLTFASDWVASYLKFLDESTRGGQP